MCLLDGVGCSPELSGCLSPRAHSALCPPQPPSAYVWPDNSIDALIPAGPEEMKLKLQFFGHLM